MHPRAVRKVAEFLEILRTNRAQVEIGFNGRRVALRNQSEVELAALSPDLDRRGGALILDDHRALRSVVGSDFCRAL